MSSPLRTESWHRTIILVAMLAFSAFVLWLTATNFDASEVRSFLLLAGGFVVREFLPLVRTLLAGDGDTPGGHDA